MTHQSLVAVNQRLLDLSCNFILIFFSKSAGFLLQDVRNNVEVSSGISSIEFDASELLDEFILDSFLHEVISSTPKALGDTLSSLSHQFAVLSKQQDVNDPCVINLGDNGRVHLCPLDFFFLNLWLFLSFNILHLNVSTFFWLLLGFFEFISFHGLEEASFEFTSSADHHVVNDLDGVCNSLVCDCLFDFLLLEF